jgi:hypothetical protein
MGQQARAFQPWFRARTSSGWCEHDHRILLERVFAALITRTHTAGASGALDREQRQLET